MARYQDDFMGIPAHFGEPRGMDPNYRDGYRGMRLRPGGGQAPYGSHRAVRRYDLETWGGYEGIHGSGRTPGSRPPLPRSDGGVRDPFRDPDFMHDFNVRSSRAMTPSESNPAGRSLERRAQGGPRPDWMPRAGYEGRYSNRGMTQSGFSEGWARGPMRGSR